MSPQRTLDLTLMPVFALVSDVFIGEALSIDAVVSHLAAADPGPDLDARLGLDLPYLHACPPLFVSRGARETIPSILGGMRSSLGESWVSIV
jgi:hypothetical protein